MKKRFLGIVLLCTMCLTACGQSYSYSDNGGGFDIYNDSPMASMKSSVSESAVYVTGGDYSNTNINSDSADYSYNFQASGKTKKSKAEILADYEHIQEVVEEKGGFIENVYNNYQYYDKENQSYGTGVDYISTGNLSFTIEVENEYVVDVLAELEKLCVENKFTVTNYTQSIQNYQNFKIVDSYSEDDYYSDTITQEELDRRLMYADISVRLNYYNPRDGISKFGIKVSNAIEDIWDSFGEIIQVIFIIFIVLFALFGELILFYKMFVKMMYKHRHKYPKYYPPKSVYVVTNDDIPQLKAESKTIEYEKNMDSK